MKAYYEARAPEYDDWYEGAGRYGELDRPGWDDDLTALVATVAALAPARTLDVACGTGYLTRHLRGDIVGLDQSESMLAIASARVPGADFVRGDALALPFPESAFDRLFTAHFYGHLEPDERERFVGEARRVARELVVVDSAVRADRPLEHYEERSLSDGSRWSVYKRYFTAEALSAELGRGEVLFAGRWFVAVAVAA